MIKAPPNLRKTFIRDFREVRATRKKDFFDFLFEMSRNKIQYYKGSTFYGDWSQDDMEKAIQFEEEMWESMNDPANRMTTEEHLALMNCDDNANEHYMMTDPKMTPEDFIDDMEKMSLKQSA